MINYNDILFRKRMLAIVIDIIIFMAVLEIIALP